MQQLKIANHTVTLYDSVDEMPIERYHKFNQLLVLHSGLGADLDAAAEKVLLIRNLIAQKQNEKADVELLNLQQIFAFVYSSIDPRDRAFACLIKTLDGKEITETTDAGLDEIVKVFGKILSKSERDNVINTVKKKLTMR